METLRMGISVQELQELARRGDQWDAVIGFLRKNPSFTSQRFERFSETFLHWGAIHSVKVIYDLISLEENINVTDAQGKTPLDWCIQWMYYAKQESKAHMPAVIEKIKTLKECAQVLLNMQGCSYEGSTGFDSLYLSLRMGEVLLAEKMLESNSQILSLKHIDAWCLGLGQCSVGEQDDFIKIASKMRDLLSLDQIYILQRLLECVSMDYVGVKELEIALPALIEDPRAYSLISEWSSKTDNKKALEQVELVLELI